MPTRKLYIEFDEPVAQEAAIAARFNGMSLSEWINAAARHALDAGYFDVDEDTRPRLARPEIVAVDSDAPDEPNVADSVNGWLDAPAPDPTTDTATSGGHVQPDVEGQPDVEVESGFEVEVVDPDTELDEHQLVWADGDSGAGSDEAMDDPEGAGDAGVNSTPKASAKTRKAAKAKAKTSAKPATKTKKAAKPKKASKAKKAATAKKTSSAKTRSTAGAKTEAAKAKPKTSSKPKGGLMPKDRRDAMRVINRRKQPSTGTIATAAGLSRQAALRLLRSMEADGMIEWVGTSKRDPNAYWQPSAD